VPHTTPAIRPDLQEASTRNRTACHIMTGFARATPELGRPVAADQPLPVRRPDPDR
jgi:hypothetical protein